MFIRCLWQIQIRCNLFWTSCWRTSPSWWTSWANSKQIAQRTSSSATKRTISSSKYEISRGPHHRRMHRGQKNRTEQLRWWLVLCSWGNDEERMTNRPLSDPISLQLTSKMCKKIVVVYVQTQLFFFPPLLRNLLCEKQEGLDHSTPKLFPLVCVW